MNEREIVELVEAAAAEAVRIADPDNALTWILPLNPWATPAECSVIETELRRRFPNWTIEVRPLTDCGVAFP